MNRVETIPFRASSPYIPRRSLRIGSTVLSAVSIALFATVVIAWREQGTSLLFLVGVAVVLSTVIALHTRFLLQLRSQQNKVFSELQTTAQDKHQVERQLEANRALARSASAEAEALRTTALTFTRNWQLDRVLDTLLESLAVLVPYESARVLLIEDDSRLFAAREKVLDKREQSKSAFPVTLDLAGFPLFRRILKEQSPVVLADVSNEREWKVFPSLVDTRSWLCVPLVAADRSLGLLCADHSQVGALTSEHLRLAGSLAVSIAAAIQNARLYEQALIYGTELERRISDLRHTRRALEQVEEQRLVSEEKFQTIFRSSPIAFSITTLEGGHFLDVNAAFEQRYGYARSDLIGHSVFEIGLWKETSDRTFMISQLDRGGPVRNLMTQLRTKSGDLKLTSYSANKIQFDGKVCILAVSADAMQYQPSLSN